MQLARTRPLNLPSNHTKAILLQNQAPYVDLMHTAIHWLMRAADARTLAEEEADSEAKKSVLAIAVGYEKLAQHAASIAEIGLPLDGPDLPQA